MYIYIYIHTYTSRSRNTGAQRTGILLVRQEGRLARRNKKQKTKSTEVPAFPAEVTMVVGMSPASPLLAQAKAAGIEAVVCKGGGSQVLGELDDALARNQAQLVVVLDDFDVSVLDAAFCRRWEDKLLVVRASLLQGSATVADAVSQAPERINI